MDKKYGIPYELKVPMKLELLLVGNYQIENE